MRAKDGQINRLTDRQRVKVRDTMRERRKERERERERERESTRIERVRG